jgi:hypothetical protein
MHTDLQGWYELGEGNKEEVKVEEELELLVEYEREEGEYIVFLVPDDVRWEFRLHLI